jgi:hypothetical protein
MTPEPLPKMEPGNTLPETADSTTDDEREAERREEQEEEEALRTLGPVLERHAAKLKRGMRRVFTEAFELSLKTTCLGDEWHRELEERLGYCIWHLEEARRVGDLKDAETDELFRAGLLYLLDEFEKHTTVDLMPWTDWCIYESEKNRALIMAECAEMDARRFCRWVKRNFPEDF